MVKAYPAPLRWFVERTLPIYRKIRSDRAILTSILAPIFAERKAEIATAKQENREPSLPNDSIEWFRNASGDGGAATNGSYCGAERVWVTENRLD